jgi:hypothetical protein
MALLSLLLILTSFVLLPDKSDCPCRPALESDQPHGANETIEYSGGTVKRIQGRIILSNGEPLSEAVVEVYDYPSNDRNKRPFGIAELGKRKTACLSDKNGNFCFADLPPGWYVLKIGTREFAGINESYVRVKLDRTWWRSWLRAGKRIEVRLNLGT